jgi:hypothetical protein
VNKHFLTFHPSIQLFHCVGFPDNFHFYCFFFCGRQMRTTVAIMVSSGFIDEAVQFLCVIGDIPAACRILSANGQWDAAVALAKVRVVNFRYLAQSSRIQIFAF